ncbi:MAG: carbohydrate ABC transporter permease [Spirochaetaceae bacterium]|nr:MAG: carbohydrate ABC transporter permease [Spirochaetaceae bacterium]
MTKARSTGDKIFDSVNVVAMLILVFLTLYPFWFVLVGSLSSGVAYTRARGVYWWPVQVTLANFQVVFREPGILSAFWMTVYRAAAGTITHLIVTSLFAYAFSKRHLMGRSVYAMIGMITMFFSGGIIPGYLVRQYLGLLDTFWVLIIPAMINFWNVIIFRAFFAEIPDSIGESAKIDGAGEYRIFLQLIVPLSAAVFAAIALFTGVWHWNDFMQPLIFTTSSRFETLPLLLMRTIRTREAASGMATRAAGLGIAQDQINPLTIQMATMIVAVAPILLLYPFLQRYFVKGIMLGSIKG